MSEDELATLGKELEQHPEFDELKSQFVAEAQNFRSSNWYDFNVTHWGCKWNASDSDVEIEHEADKQRQRLEVNFDLR